MPMPPCVVRPVGPPARAGEHSKPSCLQARAVRARRSDVLGVGGGVPSPKRPKNCPRARAFPGYSYRGGCHPPALSSYSLVAPVVPASGCRGPPTIHPSIHPSIHPFRSASPSLEPATLFSMPITHVFMPVALLRSACAHLCHARPHAVTIRWRSPCDTRFAPPPQSRPVRLLQWNTMPHAGVWGGACAGARGAMVVGARWAGRGDRRQKLH